MQRRGRVLPTMAALLLLLAVAVGRNTGALIWPVWMAKPPFDPGNGRRIIPLPFAAGTVRCVRSGGLLLRGGFDVWGDDDDEPAEPTKKVGLREVRQAAREASAKAMDFKKVAGGAARVGGLDKGVEQALEARGDAAKQAKFPQATTNDTKMKKEFQWLDLGPRDGSPESDADSDVSVAPERAVAEDEEQSSSNSISSSHGGILPECNIAETDGAARSQRTMADTRDGRAEVVKEGVWGGEQEEEEEEEDSDGSDENAFGSREEFEQHAMDLNSDDFDFDAPGLAEVKQAGSGGLDEGDLSELIEDEDEGSDSSSFQPNPKWLLPEFQPPGWVESDTPITKKSNIAADVAEVMAGSMGAGKGATSAKRDKGKVDAVAAGAGKGGASGKKEKGKKSKDKGAELAEGVGKMSVKGGLAALVPLHRIALPGPGVKCNMDGSTDPHYRYTMPGISIKVEGATKMIKTVLMNLEEVCQSLGRPAEYLVTYFGQECSSMATIDHKAGIEGRAWVSGKHEQQDLQRLVFRFIRDCCLCRKCAGPETAVVVEGKKKRKTVSLDCKSCGAKTPLDDAARFTKWISTRPPGDGGAAWGQVDSGMGGKGKEEELEGIDAPVAKTAAFKPAKETKAEAREDRGGEARGEAGAMLCQSVEELKTWRDEQAKQLKKLLRAGLLSEDEYEVRKMNVKDIYRARKMAFEGEEGASDDAGMMFSPVLDASML